MPWKGWEGVQESTLGKNRDAAASGSEGHQRAPGAPGGRPAAAGGPKAGPDRGSRRGAKRVIVTADGQIIEQALAKAEGIKGAFFQSKREALQWLAHTERAARGEISQLRRQVHFALQTRNPQGLMETVSTYIADIVYVDGNGKQVVVDVKPSGGHREDLYLLKRKWFRAQYGLEILEVH